VSRDNGTTWTNVTPKGLPESLVSIVEPSPHDAGTAYAAINRYKHGDDAPYVYKTTDYGATWTLVVKGIPKGAFARVVREDPFRKGLLYAGTERGLYISFDAGATWSRFRRNLPLTPIHDLVIHPTEKDLVICTHGRSFWILDDLTPLHNYNGRTSSLLTVYPPRHTYRVNGGAWNSPTMNVGENAPSGVQFHYQLSDTTSKELTLTIRTQQGDSIISFSSARTPKGKPFDVNTTFYRDSLHRASDEALTLFRGGNRFAWDMLYPGAEPLEGALLWGGGTEGPRAMPGTYIAEFALDTDTQRVQFEIRMDPRVTTPREALQAQFDLHQQINATLSRVHTSIASIRTVRTSISAMQQRVGDLDTATTRDVRASMKTISDSLTTIENVLVQTKAVAFQDLLNYPVKLNNKIASLASVAASADRRPTQQVYDLYATLKRQADAQCDAVDAIVTKNLADVNERIGALKLPAIAGPKKDK
jgi:hypothetical protein